MDYPDVYLPTQKYGSVEQHLLKQGVLRRIYDIDELKAFHVFPSAWLAQIAQATGCAIIASCRQLGVTYPIHFCLVRSNVRNAMAIMFDDWACIVISDALGLQIFYFIEELSFSQYFVRYREAQTQFDATFKYPLTPRRITMNRIAESRAMNKEQGRLVKTLTWVSVMFIAHHELAHIANGHLSSGLIGTALAEDRQTSTPDTLQVLRTLEFDADALGVQLTLNYTFGALGNAGDSTEFVKDELDVTHTVFAGVYIAMCVIEAVQIDNLKDFHDYTHPPAILRLFAVSSAAQSAARMLATGRFISLSEKAVYDALNNVTRAIEWAIGDRAQAAPDPETLIAAVTLQHSHDADLYKCWARIRPRLDRCKLGLHKLAAAQYDLEGRPLQPAQPAPSGG
jgi:hypothetical protein